MLRNVILTRKHIAIAAAFVMVVAAAVYGFGQWAPGGAEITTAPHQALYRLTLSRLRSGSSIAGVSGQMTYRIEDVCDGWNVAQRFNMQFVYPQIVEGENPSASVVSDYNTYESKDEKHFQFSTRRMRNGQVTEEILGKADRQSNGTGTIVYQRPRMAQVDLPTDVFFPNQHTLKILEAAAAGKKVVLFPLFDGSDTALATDVNNVISPAHKPYVVKVVDMTPVKLAPVDDTENDNADTVDTSATPAAAQTVTPMTADALNHNPLIENTRAWRIRMAFFSRSDALKTGVDSSSDEHASMEPDYEMTMILHSNGVVSSCTLDYPDFSLDADLISIAEVAKNGC